MEFSAKKIAEILNGTIEGNPDVFRLKNDSGK